MLKASDLLKEALNHVDNNATIQGAVWDAEGVLNSEAKIEIDDLVKRYERVVSYFFDPGRTVELWLYKWFFKDCMLVEINDAIKHFESLGD